MSIQIQVAELIQFVQTLPDISPFQTPQLIEQLQAIQSLKDDELTGLRLIKLSSLMEEISELQSKLNADTWLPIQQKIDLIYSEIQQRLESTDYLSANAKREDPDFSDRVKRFFTVGVSNYKFGNLTNMFLGHVSNTTKKLTPFSHSDQNQQELTDFNKQFSLSEITNISQVAAMDPNLEEMKKEEKQTQGNFGYHCKRYLLDTTYGQSINVFETEISNKDSNNNAHKTLYVVTLHGQGSCGAKQHALRAEEARQYLKANPDVEKIVIVSPDYPGSVASGGYYRTMVELADFSGGKCVRHLIARGVPQEQIILRGFSLGGHVATIAAERLKRVDKIEVGLLAVDTFASFHLFAGDGKAVQDLAGGLVMKHLNEDAVDAFLSLDPKRVLCINREGDKLIWENDGHQNRGLVWGVMSEIAANEKRFPDGAPKEQLTLILPADVGDHNHDLILMGAKNPCLERYKQSQEQSLGNQPAM